MNVKYDKKADAMYIQLTEAPFFKSQRVTPNLNIDLDEEGGVIGIEIVTVKGEGIDPTVYAAPSEAVILDSDEEIEKRHAILVQKRLEHGKEHAK
jgi:uncharacterized protein YuzE